MAYGNSIPPRVTKFAEVPSLRASPLAASRAWREAIRESLGTVNYETPVLRLFCHCEHFAVALHRLREAIQKQGRATWIASGSALAMTESGVS